MRIKISASSSVRKIEREGMNVAGRIHPLATRNQGLINILQQRTSRTINEDRIRAGSLSLGLHLNESRLSAAFNLDAEPYNDVI